MVCRFRSLHCLLYPKTTWCVEKKEMLQKLWQESYDYDRNSSILFT